MLEIPFNLSAGGQRFRSSGKISRYAGDFADACLVVMAGELDTGDILTLDSDFIHYRWRRNRRFNLLIPLD